MKQYYIFLFGLLWHFNCSADALRFDEPVIVASASKGVFYHLDASGRQSLAISKQVVAVTWEDNSSGKPAIYVAYLLAGKKSFSKPVRVSGESAAYESVIIELDGARFLVGWEEADHVWLRVVSPAGSGNAIKLSKLTAKQVNVGASHAGDIAAVWVEGQNSQFSVHYADIEVKAGQIQVATNYLVDNSKENNRQLYPVVEYTEAGRVVAWEDRRHGHTRIFTAFAPDRKRFSAYRLLNEFSPSPSPEFGKGSGAMRPVLASDGKRLLVAAWMDKRNWRSGYDVYAALSNNSGKEFGSNEKAQDLFAEDIPQWHASAALRTQDGVAVLAWDDTRNESPDVFYSLRVNGNWSDDYELPGATGPGRQSHPAIKFDEDGVLHAVWLDNNGHSRLFYSRSAQ